MSAPGDSIRRTARSVDDNASLSELDTAEIFFSFDITTIAFSLETRGTSVVEGVLSTIPVAPETNDFRGIGALLATNIIECARKTTTWAYLLLLILLLALLLQLRPLRERSVESITAMLPPEMALPRPPRPAVQPGSPKDKPVPEKKKPAKKPPTPREKKLEKIRTAPPKKVRPVERKALVKPRRPVRPSEQRDLRVRKTRRTAPADDQRLRMQTHRRQAADEVPGLKVRAATRADTAGDIPRAFGTARKHGTGDTGVSRLSVVRSRRKAPAEPVEKDALPTPGRPRTVTEPAADAPLPVEPAKERDARIEDEISGIWKRIENIGPLAQLNALCYRRPPGAVVYKGVYRLRCKNNQIVAAWRRVEGP